MSSLIFLVLGTIGVAYLVGWLLEKKEMKKDCDMHSWSISVLDNKMYCMDCNKRSDVTHGSDE